MQRNRVWKRWSAAASVTAVAMLTSSPLRVEADVPPVPAAVPFNAPLCAGETDIDPTDAGAPNPDTTLIFGGRLDTYNAGGVIALYDVFGSQDPGAYPAVCGTRYVASVGGPVSEWMFCTDITAHVCGGTTATGESSQEDVVVAPIAPLGGPNPKLGPDQEALIAFLIQHGHTYAGVGNQSFGGTTVAVQDATSTTGTRSALQTLIWCISDTPALDDTSDFAATCAANMDAAEQARLLALIPGTPSLTVTLTSSSATATVGDVVAFTLSTNMFSAPITMTSSPPALVALCPGETDASLVGDQLSVNGTDASAPLTVDLCVTVATAGTTTVAASGTPPSIDHIGWNQSPGAPGIVCQVFATFQESSRTTVGDSATVAVAAAASTTTTSTTTTTTTAIPTTTAAITTTTAARTVPIGLLPTTGSTTTVVGSVAGLLLVFLGGLLVIATVRRRPAKL